MYTVFQDVRIGMLGGARCLIGGGVLYCILSLQGITKCGEIIFFRWELV